MLRREGLDDAITFIKRAGRLNKHDTPAERAQGCRTADI